MTIIHSDHKTIPVKTNIHVTIKINNVTDIIRKCCIQNFNYWNYFSVVVAIELLSYFFSSFLLFSKIKTHSGRFVKIGVLVN